jgi:hypothetical protein
VRRARRLRGSVTLAFALIAAAPAHALTAPVPAASPAPALPAADCSWFGETDQRDGNIGAPDLDAFYWMSAPLTPSAGAKIVLTGSYPHARYFSFHVYGAQGNALGSIYDQQITPDGGSANPFRGRAPRGSGDEYTAYVSFTSRPSRPAPNTIYVNPSDAGAAALLVYRIYVPADPTAPNGDVPFPQVSQETASGQQLSALAACATTPPAFGSLLWEQIAAQDYPQGLPPIDDGSASAIPTWQRSFGNQLGNQQNAYLVTSLSRRYGDLVVLHTKAPTFPNTRARQPVYGRHQLRYWSLCTYDSSGQAAIGCAADYAAAIRGGSITYVISDPGTRPANANAAHGVTWLPWGAQPSAQLVDRNMLPASWFRFAVQRVTPSSSVPKVLGSYYPQAVYCQPAIFARGGWRGCFAAAGLKGAPKR